MEKLMVVMNEWMNNLWDDIKDDGDDADARDHQLQTQGESGQAGLKN